MKILHFSALDGNTGAGVAAARLHLGLLERGVESRFCVAFPASGLPESFSPGVCRLGRVERSVRQMINIRRLGRAGQGYDYVLSSGDVGFDMGKVIAREQPDLIQLHWIAGNAFRLWSLAGVKLPIIWRLSDQWPFCGLQHLEPDETAYAGEPATGGATWSERIRRRKRALYRTLPQLRLVAPSRWMMAAAGRSALLGDRSIDLIPTSCDTRTFFPRERAACRAVLGLKHDENVILAGATSLGTQWKGLDLLVDAVLKAKMRDPARPLTVLTFGADTTGMQALNDAARVVNIGLVRDRLLMAMLYSAADVFAAPSRMENLSNAVLESLACGTPVVAFDIGGMPDMIDHHQNGALAAPFDTDQFADGLLWALDHRNDPEVVRAAREKIDQRFSLDQEVGAYLSLYQSVLAPL